MKWENLTKFICPHCENPLQKSSRDDAIHCTECLFFITYQRYQAILLHRSQKPDFVVKMKWQNIIDNVCPVCESRMRDQEGSFDIHRCSNANCSFKIREDSLQAILANKTHVAWRFYVPKEDRK